MKSHNSFYVSCWLIFGQLAMCQECFYLNIFEILKWVISKEIWRKKKLIFLVSLNREAILDQIETLQEKTLTERKFKLFHMSSLFIYSE